MEEYKMIKISKSEICALYSTLCSHLLNIDSSISDAIKNDNQELIWWLKENSKNYVKAYNTLEALLTDIVPIVSPVQNFKNFSYSSNGELFVKNFED